MITFTVSRAFHLMRYGEKIVKPVNAEVYFRIRNGVLQELYVVDANWFDCTEIPAEALMGNWEEVL